MTPPVAIRRGTSADVDAVVELAGRALGWNDGEPNNAFFRWKHLENPAGPSPMWLAFDREMLVGVRVLLNWRFIDHSSGSVVTAVRAVDTATHPDHQGRGIFRLLTTSAVDDLTSDGVGFVFNTPNSSSRPGYLRFGWRDEGRVPIAIDVGAIGAARRLLGARTAAAKWSEPTTAGLSIAEAIDAVSDAYDDSPSPKAGFATQRTADHFQWRYGFEPLHYRVFTDDNSVAIARVRRRGTAREGVVAELVAPNWRSSDRMLSAVRKALDIDHLIITRTHPAPRPKGVIPVPRLGPLLTVRDLAATAPGLSALHLTMGDIELF